MSFLSHEFVDIIFCKYLDILEIISGCRSDPFTLIDLELPANFYMIACTDIWNFEEGENCVSTISVEHTLRSNMNLFGYDMNLFCLSFKFQYLPFIIVSVLINFGVKNQVPQVSFKIVVGDLM